MQGGGENSRSQQATGSEPSRPTLWPHRDSPSRRRGWLICRLSPRVAAFLPPPPSPEDSIPVEATILKAGQLHIADEACHVVGYQLRHSHARIKGPKLILRQVVPARIVKVPSVRRAHIFLNQDCAFGPCPEPRACRHAGDLATNPGCEYGIQKPRLGDSAQPPRRPSTAGRPGPVPHGPAVLPGGPRSPRGPPGAASAPENGPPRGLNQRQTYQSPTPVANENRNQKGVCQFGSVLIQNCRPITIDDTCSPNACQALNMA